MGAEEFYAIVALGIITIAAIITIAHEVAKPDSWIHKLCKKEVKEPVEKPVENRQTTEKTEAQKLLDQQYELNEKLLQAMNMLIDEEVRIKMEEQFKQDRY